MNLRLAPSLLLTSICTLAMTGCSLSSLNAPSSSLFPDTQLAGTPIRGMVHGGYQPLTGAHIHLMAAAATGYGAAATSIMTSGDGTDAIGYYVTTIPGGGFNITGDYNCISGQQVYLLATGGNPGLSPSTVNNTAATMMAAFGTCPSSGSFFGQIPFVTVNEVSTVAAAYALAGFMLDPTHIGSSGTSLAKVGLSNAFANIPNIVSLTYGQAYATTPAVTGYTSGTLSANGVVPRAKLYTLADVAAACVNSTGPASSACVSFFNNTPNSSGTKPTDVATALLNLAHNPANSYNFVNLSTSTAPFQPTLTAAPTDWALSVKYTSPNASTPSRPVIDAAGDVWVPNTGSNSLTEYSPQGVVLSGNGGFTGSGLSEPASAAIDLSGNIWVGNFSSGAVSKFNNSGTSATVAGFSTNNGASSGIAISQSGNAWTSGVYATTGVSQTGASVYSTTASTNDSFLVIDYANRLWATDFDSNNLNSIYLNASNAFAQQTLTPAGLNAPAGISSDASGNLWIANSGANTVTKVTTGTSNTVPTIGTATSYTGGGIFNPYYTAIDGAGTVWVGNSNGSLSNLSAAGAAISPAAGYTTASTTSYAANPNATVLGFLPAYGIYGLAVDGSGDVWASDSDGSMYQFLGIASPTLTPLAYNNTGIKP